MAKRTRKTPAPPATKRPALEPSPPRAVLAHFGPPAPVNRTTGFAHLCQVLHKTGQEGADTICEEAALRIEQLEKNSQAPAWNRRPAPRFP